MGYVWTESSRLDARSWSCMHCGKTGQSDQVRMDAILHVIETGHTTYWERAERGVLIANATNAPDAETRLLHEALGAMGAIGLACDRLLRAFAQALTER